MKEAFLQSIRDEYPNEKVTRLVFADWCAENEPELEEKLRRHISPSIDLFRNPRYYSCISSHYGNGGHRHSFGDGGNYCYGNGNGNGYGTGVIDFLVDLQYNNLKISMPKLHQNQLILLPYEIAFCGYVKEHIGPYVFRLENACYLKNNCHTWEDVAKRKRHLSFRRFGTIHIGPQFYCSMDWEGELP